MPSKHRKWTGEDARAALVSDRGGDVDLGRLWSRLSLSALLRVAAIAREAVEHERISASTVFAALFGIVIEANPIGDRSTAAPLGRIAAHVGLDESTMRRAIPILERVGIIRTHFSRGKPFRIELLNGVDAQLANTESASNPIKMRRVRIPRPHRSNAHGAGRLPAPSTDPALGCVPTNRTVRAQSPHGAGPRPAPNEALNQTQHNISNDVATVTTRSAANSLDMRERDPDARARARDPSDPEPAPNATPTLPIDAPIRSGNHELCEGADTAESDPELRRGEESNPSTNVTTIQNADSEPSSHDFSTLDRNQSAATDDSRIILRVREQDTLRSLGIADYVIRGASAAGITSAEVLPVIAASEVRRERWLRASEIGRWIRTTAAERGHPIADPTPTPAAPTKTRRAPA